MERLDFEALASSLLQSAEKYLYEWFPQGKKVSAREFAVGSLKGEPGKSLSINIQTGLWQDFATGEKGGDLISLYAAISGLSQVDAALELDPTQALSKRGVPDFHNASAVYKYRDINNKILFYIARYETGEGKMFLPFTYDGDKWVNKAAPAPRPLYGLQQLKNNNHPVVLVEGEKACDAAKKLFPDVAVLTWPGGSNSWKQANFSPLYGRKILIWPDADKPGIKCALAIAEMLAPHCPEVKYIDVDDADLPEGYDAADFIGTKEECSEWVKARTKKYEPKEVPATASSVSPLQIKNGFPDKNSKDIPVDTAANLSFMLKSLGVKARYNVISKEEEILIPNECFLVDNRLNDSIAWLKSWCRLVGLPKSIVQDYVTLICGQNPYNPVTTWITSKPWDGVSRLNDLYDTIKTKDDVLKETLIKRWLISAVAAAFSPNGVSAHGVLVFQGEQYIGKTMWFKKLVPSDLKVIADGMMLRPDDKDSVKQACSFWIVELGELDATFRKSDIAQLKAFLTRDKDIIRRPYSYRETEFARRTVFFASVNQRQFLHDDTGNRRFWTIECDSINYNHDIDMQQLWAEVYTLYKQGEPWCLRHDEVTALNGHNESFISKDPIEERIATDLAWDDLPLDNYDNGWRWIGATQLLMELGIDRPSGYEVKKCSQEVFKRNGGKRRKSNGLMRLYVPAVKNKNK